MNIAGLYGKPGRMKKDCKASKSRATYPTEPVQVVDSPVESWVFGTATCYHVTKHREFLENYTSGDFGKVYLINGDSMDVVGKGDVNIKLSSNVTWILRDVKHIPGYMWNLISVGQLRSTGKDYHMIFYDDVKVTVGDFVFTVPLDPNPPDRIAYLSGTP